MITEINMYWLTRLDGIYNLFSIGATVSVVVLCFLIPFSICAKMDGQEVAGTLCKWSIAMAIIACVGVLGAIFVPTTKEMAAIYAIPAITRSETIQKDIPELYDAGMEYLKSKIKTEAH